MLDWPGKQDYELDIEPSDKPSGRAMRANLDGGTQRVFHLVLIKPSHYDDAGYPIQWVKAAIPSNTLASLHALAEEAGRRRVLGDDVELRLY